MQIFQKIIILVLFVGVVGSGYYVYANRDFLFPKKTEEAVVKTPYPVPTENEEKININSLLGENPGPNATKEELTAFSAKVYSYAKVTNEINVSSCSPKPAVSLVYLKKPINFINSDSVAHTLINGTITINVPAKGNKLVAPEFPGPGIYGYSCDSRIVGAFLVMP